MDELLQGSTNTSIDQAAAEDSDSDDMDMDMNPPKSNKGRFIW